MKIVVDVVSGRNEGGELIYEPTGKQVAFSFGLLKTLYIVPIPQLPIPSKKWMGHDSIVLPTILQGVIYTDDYVGGEVLIEKYTTLKEDYDYFNYMNQRYMDIERGAYSPGRHSCIDFCFKEFYNTPGDIIPLRSRSSK